MKQVLSGKMEQLEELLSIWRQYLSIRCHVTGLGSSSLSTSSQLETADLLTAVINIYTVAQPDFCFQWGTTPFPFLSPLPFSLLSIPPTYPYLSLGPYPLNPARGLREGYKVCHQVRAEPGRQTVSGTFWSKIAPLLTIALDSFWSWERTVDSCSSPVLAHFLCAVMSDQHTCVTLHMIRRAPMSQILVSFRRGPAPLPPLAVPLRLHTAVYPLLICYVGQFVVVECWCRYSATEFVYTNVQIL